MNQSSPAFSQPSAATKYAIVSSGWHKAIVDNAVQAAVEYFNQKGIANNDIDLFETPGAYELPLHIKKLAETGRYQAIIACGLVVDGGIYRHEFVAAAVIDGLMRVQLDSGVPVFSAVLTPHHFQESQEHIDFFRKHFIVKGREVATACLETVASLRNLPGGIR